MQAPFFLPTTAPAMPRTVNRAGTASAGSTADRTTARSADRAPEETSGRTTTERSGAASASRTSPGANARKADRGAEPETGTASGDANAFLAEMARAVAEQAGPMEDILSHLLGEDWRESLAALTDGDARDAASLLAAFQAMPVLDSVVPTTSLEGRAAISGDARPLLAALSALVSPLNQDAVSTVTNVTAPTVGEALEIPATDAGLTDWSEEIVNMLTPRTEVLPEAENVSADSWFPGGAGLQGLQGIQRAFPGMTAAIDIGVPVSAKAEAPPALEMPETVTDLSGPVTRAADNASSTTEATSAGTRTTASPQPPFQADILEQVTRNLRGVLNRTGPSEIRVSLRPPTLGDVHLRVSSDERGISIRIMAEIPAVRDVIEQNLNQLRSDLQAQGLDVGGIDVALSEDFRDSGDAEAFADGGNGGNSPVPSVPAIEEAGGAVFTSATGGVRSGRIDYFA